VKTFNDVHSSRISKLDSTFTIGGEGAKLIKTGTV